MGKSLILTGFMGAGKSSVGRLLGKRLGMDSVDLDEAIEARTGETIARLFENRGEEEFRRLETAELEETIRKGGKVVATGGGVLTREENRRLMEGAVVVNLDAPIDTVLARISGSEDRRPLLRGGVEKVRELYERRRPLYLAVSLQIATKGKSVGVIVEEVAGLYLEIEGARK